MKCVVINNINHDHTPLYTTGHRMGLLWFCIKFNSVIIKLFLSYKTIWYRLALWELHFCPDKIHFCRQKLNLSKRYANINLFAYNIDFCRPIFKLGNKSKVCVTKMNFVMTKVTFVHWKIILYDKILNL